MKIKGKETKNWKKNKSGNITTYVPTEEDKTSVKLLVKLGYTADSICALLDISQTTYYRHYGDIIKESRLELVKKAVTVVEDIMETAYDDKTRLRAAEVALNQFKQAQICEKMNPKIEVNVNVNEDKIKKLQEQLDKNTIDLEVNEKGIYHEVDNE